MWEGIPGFLWGEMADDRSVAESETSTGVASIAATVDVDAASSVIADSSTATEVAPLPALPSPELQTPPGAEGGTADATGSESSRVLDPTGSTMDLDAIPRVSVKSHDGTEMDLTAAAQTDTHILLQTKENCVVNQYNTEVRALFSGALSKTSRSASNPAGEVDKAQVLTFGEKVFIGNQKSAAHFLLAFAREGDNGGEVIRAVVLKNGKTEAVDFNFVNVPPDKNNRKMGDIDFQNAKQARRTWLEANFTAHDPPPRGRVRDPEVFDDLDAFKKKYRSNNQVKKKAMVDEITQAEMLFFGDASPGASRDARAQALADAIYPPPSGGGGQEFLDS